MAKEFVERKALLARYDAEHAGPPGRARELIVSAPAVDVVPAVELEDLRAKYQALVAEKDKNSGDTAETYATGYRYGHRNGQIELLQQILGIFDGGSYSSAACRLKYDDINDKEGTNELDKREG